jgi:hypothetical protein
VRPVSANFKATEDRTRGGADDGEDGRGRSGRRCRGGATKPRWRRRSKLWNLGWGMRELAGAGERGCRKRGESRSLTAAAGGRRRRGKMGRPIRASVQDYPSRCACHTTDRGDPAFAQAAAAHYQLGTGGPANALTGPGPQRQGNVPPP